jgi:hypothetical protein
VGPVGFRPEPELPSEAKASIFAAVGSSRETQRVLESRGWYDQQLLAEPDGAGGLKVGSVLATLIPTPRLEQLNKDSDFDDWTVVAFAYFPEESATYKAKFNFDRGLNRIFLRRGPAVVALPKGVLPVRICESDNSTDPWWAKIESAGGDVKFYCANRWKHSGGDEALPGTVRWRWLDDDEKTWIRCPTGCCPIA